MRFRVTTLIVLGLALAAVGCASSARDKRAQNSVTKTFFGRTIEYRMDPVAKESLAKLELLVSRARDVDAPVPDDVVLPLYRDADMDRDHYITATEAETYYSDFILRFEDSLGSVKLSSVED